MTTRLAHVLTHQGHEVEVFCLSRSAELWRRGPFRVHAVRPRFILYPEYPVVAFSLAAFRALRRRHREKPFDVSHAMNFNNFGLTFHRRAMRREGLAHVSTAFETTQMEIAAKWQEIRHRPTLHSIAQVVMEGLLAPWQRSYIGWADRISTEDVETRRQLEPMGILGERVDLVPSGVDLEWIEEKQSPPQLPWAGQAYWLCPGRVDARKGSQFLLRAYAALKGEKPQLVFCGGGRGDYLGAMKKLSQDLDVDERVHFTGKVDDMRPYFHHGQAVVIPSLSEGIPITLQEALACGKGVLCSRLPGTYPFAKHLPSVMWSEPGSVDSLIYGLEKLRQGVRDVDLEAGRAFMKKHDWSSVAQAYVGVYRRAMESLRSP